MHTARIQDTQLVTFEQNMLINAARFKVASICLPIGVLIFQRAFDSSILYPHPPDNHQPYSWCHPGGHS
jgi:hypothetical protein